MIQSKIQNPKSKIFLFFIPILAVLATLPILEMGANDDWSYTLTARDLAVAGHLVYNGWATVMLGVQAYWAALFIKLFGFSFTLVRLTTLPFVAGCAILLQRLNRLAGLSPSLAMLGTLTVVLSPVFIPLAASFMTDVPGFFFLLLFLYFCARFFEKNASEQERRGWLGDKAYLWVLAAGIAGVLGGTVRQVIWSAPLGLLPYLAWRSRSNRRVALTVLGVWLGSALCIIGLMAWYHSQPYSLRENNWTMVLLTLESLPQSLLLMLRFGLTLALFLLPVLLGCLAVWRSTIKRRPILLTLIFAAAATTAVLLLGDDALAPFAGNVVTQWGIMFNGQEAIGEKPVTLIPPIRMILSLATFAILAILCLAAVESLRRRFLTSTPKHEDRPPSSDMMRLWTVFSICYLMLILPRIGPMGVYDRYLIPLLPAAAAPILLLYQRKIGPRAPLAGWIIVGLFAFYGIATTHDYFAAARARLSAANLLTAAGVPRTQITAGMNYDGWTQIDVAGYVNDERITTPAGAYVPQHERAYPISPGFWYWPWTPSIQPMYFVVLSPHPGLEDTSFPPVRYTTWLPPFVREVRIQGVRGSGAGDR